MNKIETGLDLFIEKYHPIRNTLSQYSDLDNLMFDAANEDEFEYIELYNEKESEKSIWSYTENRILKNGLYFGPSIIGYIVCKISCEEERGTIQYQI